MKTKKIVITGSPGTGKSSVINALKNKKFECFDEIIRSLTLEAKKEGDASSHVSNPIAFVNDPMTFNTNLINGRVSQFKQADALKEDTIFFDRGIPDVLAYMGFFKQELTDYFIRACEIHAYTHVYILPPWEAIYKRDNERLETFQESLEIHKHLMSTYKRFGYTIVDVPFDTIENRTDYILKHIGKI